jgi:hypothetical protein
VERAIDIFPNEVYGPGLVSAHVLESEVAQYPRVVVGPGLMRYLAALQSRRPDRKCGAGSVRICKARTRSVHGRGQHNARRPLQAAGGLLREERHRRKAATG